MSVLSTARRVVLFVLAGALLLAGCATAASHASPAHPAGPRVTVVHAFAAYDADGTLRTPVARTEPGTCWTRSIAASGPGAYRCFSGNTILDPCFALTAGARSVACLADPWSRAVVVTLTKRLPALDGVHIAPRPWAFRLAGGARCVASTGTVPQVRGVNLDYRCSDGTAAALRHPYARLVTATTARPEGHTLHRVAVPAVWHG